jgi:hypothetical protein
MLTLTQPSDDAIPQVSGATNNKDHVVPPLGPDARGGRPRAQHDHFTWLKQQLWKHPDVDTQVIAGAAVALLAIAAAFQVGLAAGAPWGAAAYGGRAVSDDGSLPRVYRLASGMAALVLLGAVWVVLASVSAVARGHVSLAVLTITLWCLAAMFGLNTLGNARGRHPLERWGASTVTALLAILCALIAVN